MKKTEKIERLLTIEYYGISDQKLKDIAKRWSHKGLDLLLENWHKHYDTKCHRMISYLLVRFSENTLKLDKMDKVLSIVEDNK